MAPDIQDPRREHERREHAAREGDLRLCLELVSRGDQQALGALFDATSALVHALTLRLLDDHQLAEEVTLDTYLQVWRQAQRFDPARGGVLSWMLVIARSRARDARRSRGVRARAETAGVHQERTRRAESVEADPARSPEGLERGVLLRRALAGLPEDQRRAIQLAYFDGLSQGEIAQRLGAPLGTIKTRIRLGLLKLRHGLRALEEER